MKKDQSERRREELEKIKEQAREGLAWVSPAFEQELKKQEKKEHKS